MSWWDTGNGDDVIGDQSADLVRHALQQIAEARAKGSQEKPTLAELLRAIGIVAISAGGQMLEDKPANPRKIVAELKSGETISSGPFREDAGTSDLVPILAGNLRAIAEVYQERWERKPRLSELLYAFEFVLRYRPEDFLRDGLEHPPTKLK